MIRFVLFSLLVTSLCQSVPLELQDELLAEVNKRVNTEINFDETLQKYNLTSFRTLLMQAKLFDRLNVTSTSFTVFAPTNEAIMHAPKGLLQNTTRLPEVLLYHVHLGAWRTSMAVTDERLKTLLGGQQKIRLERYNGDWYGSCQPFGSVIDQTYDNGILDIMNGVMVPPDADFYTFLTKTSSFSTFLKYVNIARMQPLLQKATPMTLLLPNDDAFDKLPKDVVEKMDDDYKFRADVLQYHILEGITCLTGFQTGSKSTFEGSDVSVTVSGKKVLFNKNSTLIQSDIIAFNGVIQVIDTVLLPPQLTSAYQF